MIELEKMEEALQLALGPVQRDVSRGRDVVAGSPCKKGRLAAGEDERVRRFGSRSDDGAVGTTRRMREACRSLDETLSTVLQCCRAERPKNTSLVQLGEVRKQRVGQGWLS